MRLSDYKTMDASLLRGLVNTALRNDCEDLDDLVKTHDLDRDLLEARLADAGFEYLEEIAQFR